MKEGKKMENEIKCPNCGSENVSLYHKESQDFILDGVYIKWRATCYDCRNGFSVYEKYELKNRKIYK